MERESESCEVLSTESVNALKTFVHSSNNIINTIITFTSHHWVVELESNIKMIVRAQGIPLSYVIRYNNAPDQTERDTWE